MKRFGIKKKCFTSLQRGNIVNISSTTRKRVKTTRNTVSGNKPFKFGQNQAWNGDSIASRVTIPKKWKVKMAWIGNV